VLGRRFLDSGFLVRTSMTPVQNRNARITTAQTIERHVRWAKIRRSLFPVASLLEPFEAPITVASLAAAVVPGKSTLAALGFVCIFQTLAALATMRVIRGHAMGVALARSGLDRKR